MTVRIGSVWDSTQQVLAGRAGMLVPFAAIGFVVPVLVQLLLVPAGSVPHGGLMMVSTILGALLGIWAQLAIMALATHPATTQADAARAGWRRFPAALGVALVLGLAFMVAILIPMVLLGASGFDFAQAVAANGNPALMPPIPSGLGAILGLYILALALIAVWIGVRFMPLYAVVLNERRGLGAYRRSLTLTRGMTWRLIGVSLLFLIVLFVTTLAVQGVTGAVLRLALGPDRPGIVLGLVGVLGSIVTAAFMTLAYVFVARLYVATAAEHPAGPATEDGTPSL